MINASQLSRTELRKQLRQQRRSLNEQQQTKAAQALANTLFRHSAFFRCKHVALYLANDGEINPAHFAQAAQARGIECYLPALHPIRKGSLWFAKYNTKHVTNRFGISEPDPTHAVMVPARMLDVVCMPLVGFDRMGARLGMGGGFYDRTFAYKSRHKALGPKLIGLAHDFQEVEQLTSASWDIPMEAIVTDQRIIQVNE